MPLPGLVVIKKLLLKYESTNNSICRFIFCLLSENISSYPSNKNINEPLSKARLNVASDGFNLDFKTFSVINVSKSPSNSFKYRSSIDGVLNSVEN